MCPGESGVNGKRLQFEDWPSRAVKITAVGHRKVHLKELVIETLGNWEEKEEYELKASNTNFKNV